MPRQRCTVHKVRNVGHAPLALKSTVPKEASAIWKAPNKSDARVLAAAFVPKYKETVPKLAAIIEDDFETTLTFFHLDANLWRTMRSSNVVERINREMRRNFENDATSGLFRLYTIPDNRRTYWLIREEDVVGDVHVWTDDELAKHGHIGIKVFKLAVKAGAHIQIVSSRGERLGETIAANSTPQRASRRADNCEFTTGCTTGCCTWGYSQGVYGCWCDYCCYAANSSKDTVRASAGNSCGCKSEGQQESR